MLHKIANIFSPKWDFRCSGLANCDPCVFLMYFLAQGDCFLPEGCRLPLRVKCCMKKQIFFHPNGIFDVLGSPIVIHAYFLCISYHRAIVFLRRDATPVSSKMLHKKPNIFSPKWDFRCSALANCDPCVCLMYFLPQGYRFPPKACRLVLFIHFVLAFNSLAAYTQKI